MKTRYIYTKNYDNSDIAGIEVFANNMYLWFYNNNGEKKPVRMSLLNSEYIYLKIISDDDTFSVVKLEMVDEGLSEKRYG